MYAEDRVLLATVVLVIAGVVGVIYLEHRDEVRHKKVCTELYQMARTYRDTIDIRLKCELSSDNGTFLVPVATPIYSH